MDRAHRLANRAENKLTSMSEQISKAKVEADLVGYRRTVSKSGLYKYPGMTRKRIDEAVSTMESEGYQFNKIAAGKGERYAMTLENITAIYEHVEHPKYRDKRDSGFVIFVESLKGGVSKSVSTVTLAQAMRAHPDLLMHDLRILVVDLDPQASATMFLRHEHSIGQVDDTTAQAMLQQADKETLLKEFVFESSVPGVHVMPSSIDDRFLAASWNELCAEYLPEQNPNAVLKENVIDLLRDEFDFILVDTGPHLDAFLMNSLYAADLLLTPVPPAQVDFHSTLKYLSRLPGLYEELEESGLEVQTMAHLGYMAKIQKNKRDHAECHSLAKEVFGGDMLDMSLPRLDGFERVGESYDTVISADPLSYPGSETALKNAREAAEDFARCVFDRIEFIRTDNEQQ
ncbi:AAA family ATPase [Ferrimonas kyonanensis]|uniref:AAA family ATPase n=1 Tax=Ferrimonas kyonanensis TaxID=364763 RepID=UPI0012EC3E0B